MLPLGRDAALMACSTCSWLQPALSGILIASSKRARVLGLHSPNSERVTLSDRFGPGLPTRFASPAQPQCSAWRADPWRPTHGRSLRELNRLSAKWLSFS
jgi:hypothetical protein